jgi:hypothetical protein
VGWVREEMRLMRRLHQVSASVITIGRIVGSAVLAVVR